MPHTPEPFYRAPRRLWYVQLDGKQINLGREENPKKDRSGQPVPCHAIVTKYHELMADRGNAPPKPTIDTNLAVVVIDTFLDWVQRHKEPRTYEWYHRHCLHFAKAIPRTLTVSQLKPHHLTAVCDSHSWSDTNKHGFYRAVQRAFRWAERQGLIDRSPLGMVEKPEPQDRDVIITAEEYQRVLSVTNEPFRTLLMVAWESGARPQELRKVEARHLDIANGRIIFPPKDAKGKKLPRVVYMTDEASAIILPLAERHPVGPIFRNANDKPWTRYAINCAFIRVQIAFGREVMKAQGIDVPKLPRFKKSKVDPSRLAQARAEQKDLLAKRRKEYNKLAMKHGRKLHLGAFRKSFATAALKNGVDVITTSHLLGHTNPAMLAKVYAKVQADPEYMAAMARKAVKGGDA